MVLMDYAKDLVQADKEQMENIRNAFGIEEDLDYFEF